MSQSEPAGDPCKAARVTGQTSPNQTCRFASGNELAGDDSGRNAIGVPSMPASELPK